MTPVLTTEPLDLDRDIAVVYDWVTHPGSVYWEMGGFTVEQVRDEYAEIRDNPHHDAFLGRADGEPRFLVERYDPRHSKLAGLPDLRSGDIGMHLLVAPTDTPVAGFTRAVMRHALELCFADRAVDRVVVDPDVRNEKIAVINAAAGFVVSRDWQLPAKLAAISFCTRAGFAASEVNGGPGRSTVGP